METSLLVDSVVPHSDWDAVVGLTLVWFIPLQNYCIDGKHGGWSWC